jgi:hypothetical protein
MPQSDQDYSGNTLISGRESLDLLKLRLVHDLPRRLRYAEVYFEAGSASLFFSVDGATAKWEASIGRKRTNPLGLSDKEYARFRASVPAVEMLDDNGHVIVLRDADGYEERWQRPQWVLVNLRKARDRKGEAVPVG